MRLPWEARLCRGLLNSHREATQRATSAHRIISTLLLVTRGWMGKPLSSGRTMCQLFTRDCSPRMAAGSSLRSTPQGNHSSSLASLQSWLRDTRNSSPSNLATSPLPVAEAVGGRLPTITSASSANLTNSYPVRVHSVFAPPLTNTFTGAKGSRCRRSEARGGRQGLILRGLVTSRIPDGYTFWYLQKIKPFSGSHEPLHHPSIVLRMCGPGNETGITPKTYQSWLKPRMVSLLALLCSGPSPGKSCGTQSREHTSPVPTSLTGHSRLITLPERALANGRQLKLGVSLWTRARPCGSMRYQTGFWSPVDRSSRRL